MWSVTSHKNGASAIGLQRELGLGSYKTAWTWLHKLRRAMMRPGRDRLFGRVEVDETYWGNEEEGIRGRQTESQALIVIAAQEDRAGIGRIRMRHIADASAESLMPFVEEAIEPGSIVWIGYLPLKGKGSPSPRRLPEGTEGIGFGVDATGSQGGVSAESVGCWAHTKVRSAGNTWTTTWTNSRSVSIGEIHVAEESFSCASPSTPSLWDQRPTSRW